MVWPPEKAQEMVRKQEQLVVLIERDLFRP
jgi:hypothetical protein